ncbi:MAG: GNAT family N-acetyltransferase [Myxococcales bacterium]|nr:GNAT family N-acetyltransferase [Myxococcales bacterium]
MYRFEPISREKLESLPVEMALPPVRLLCNYAEYCTEVFRGSKFGAYSVLDVQGRAIAWIIANVYNGRIDALPDRMYGLVRPKLPTPLDVDLLYRGLRTFAGGTFRVHLPPAELSGPYVAGDKNKLARYVAHDTFVLRARTEEEAWAKVERVGRQGVKKAEKEGVEVDVSADPMTLIRYLSLNVAKSSRVGSPPFNRSILDRLQKLFGPRLQVALARIGKEAVAAVLFVMDGPYAMLIDNASKPEFWHLNPNNLAVWSAIKTCITQGVTVVDYGFSDKGDEGAARFKTHMGAEKLVTYMTTAN